MDRNVFTCVVFVVVLIPVSSFDGDFFSAPATVVLQCNEVVPRPIQIALVTEGPEDSKNLTLPSDFHTQRVNDSYFLFQGRNGTCFPVQTTPVFIKNGKYMGIYNITQLTTLDNSDMIVGAYLHSVAMYSFHNHKIYMSTTPLPFFLEHTASTGTPHDHQYLFSLWPAYHSMTDAVNMFMKFRTSHDRHQIDVFIIRYAETLDETNYANAIYKSLLDNEGIRYLDDYSIHAEVNQIMDLKISGVERDVMEIYTIFNHLRLKLSAKSYDIIVLLMDFRKVSTYITILNELFSKAADLEKREVHWLIPDMTFGHRMGMLEAIHNVHVIQSKLTFIQQKKYGDCLEIGEGIEERGMIFAMETLRKSLSTMSEDEFSIHHLWTTLRTQRSWSPKTNDARKDTHASRYDGTFPRDVTMSFVDYSTTEPHPYCSFRSTAVYMNHDNPHKASLSAGGGFADAKTIQAHNESSLFYGLIPLDAELEAVVVEDEPFVRLTESGDFEGIVIDIFNEMRKTLLSQGVFLNLNLRKVDFYGGKVSGAWNGAFGELDNNKRTKVALGQISMTEERKRDFDFTPPFGFIHRTYLIRKQEKSDIYTQFARPFTNLVWFTLLCIVVASSFYIFLLDRWNPFRDKVPREFRFTGYEAAWYSYLTMCHLSAPFAARNLPIQIFSLFYCFFSMIVIGSYTGNLASSLTDAYFVRPDISSDIHLLPQQREFRFGTVAHSSTSNEMKNITSVTGDSLYDIIQRRGDFVENYAQGFQRVRDEDYILIGTSGVMTHFRNNDPNCSLELNSESYYNTKQIEIGFAMKKDWELKYEFSNAMAFLMETGRIATIYNKWLKQGQCDPNSDGDAGHARMDFRMLTGLFVMLAFGIFLSYIVLFIKLGYLKLTGRKDKLEREEKELQEQEKQEREEMEKYKREKSSTPENDRIATEGDAVVTDETEKKSDYDNMEMRERKDKDDPIA